MALTDRLNDTPSRPTGKPCSVGSLSARLDPTESQALDEMMFSLGWPWSQIHKALEAEGHWVSGQQINRHRSRACSCWKASA